MSTSLTPHPVVPTAPRQGALARFWHQLGPGSRRRHEQARVEAYRLASLRALWQEACHHAGLGLTVYAGSGSTTSVPRVMRADFGPPVSFTVALRPGQCAADLRAAEPRLARALQVRGLWITGDQPGWVTVVVVDPLDGSGPGGGWDEAHRDGSDGLPTVGVA